jgi:hypothetical protein
LPPRSVLTLDGAGLEPAAMFTEPDGTTSELVVMDLRLR